MLGCMLGTITVAVTVFANESDYAEKPGTCQFKLFRLLHVCIAFLTIEILVSLSYQ